MKEQQVEDLITESDAGIGQHIIENTADGILIIDQDGALRFVNPAAEKMFGRPADELVGESFGFPLVAGEKVEIDVRRLDDGTTSAEMRAVETEWEGERVFLASLRDVTERKQAERKLRKTNRALQVLSECNQVLVRATDESALLRDVCQIIVEDGGYRLAWVGFAEEDDAKTVRPVAQAGFEDGYLDAVNITWADTERGAGPTGQAIRSGKPSIARNIQADPKFAPWREQAVKRGYASSIALPLVSDGGSLGALCVYAEEPDAFDSEEVKLLSELADDLAYGIGALRTHTAEAEAKAALQRQRDLVAQLMDTSPISITFVNRQGEIVFANRHAQEVLGLSREEITQRTYDAPEWHITDFDGNPFPEEQLPFRQVMETGEPVYDVRHAIEWPDGQRVLLAVNGAPLLDEQGQLDGAVFTLEDVTEQVRSQEELRKLSNVVKQTADIVVITDTAGVIEYVNPAFEETTGYTAEEVLGETPRLLKSGEHEAAFYQELWETIAAGDVFRAEFINRKKNGELFYQENTITPITNQAGEITHFVSTGRDVTERKQAEKALRESEQEYRQLAETATDIILTHDLDGHITYMNRAGLRIGGYSADEIAELSITDLVPAEERDALYARGEKRHQGDPSVDHYETKLVTQDGELVPVDVNSSLLTKNGQPAGILVIARDISDRKRTEQQLQESQRRLQALFDSAQDAFLLANNAGEYVDANPAACELLGYSYEEITELNLADITPGLKYEQGLKLWQDFIEAGEQAGEYQLLRKDGELVDADYRAVANIVPGLHLSVMRDITERKQAERQLRRREEYYRSLIENASDVITVLDHDGTIRYESPALQTVLGYQPEDLIGESAFDLVHSDDLPQVLDAFEGVIANPGTVSASIEFRMQHKDGSWHILEGVGKALPEDSDAGAIVINTRDITQRRQHEREQRAIAEVALALREASTRAEMLPATLDQVMDLVNADSTALALRDPATGGTVIELTRGRWSSATTGTRLPAGAGITGQVIESREPYVTPDLRSDEHFAQPDLINDAYAAACVPLIADQDTIGALWAVRPSEFSADTVRVLSVAADIAANAIQRATWYERSQRRIEQLQALRSIDMAITASTNPHVVLSVVLDQIMDQLAADAAAVLLLDPHTHMLEHAASRGFRTDAIAQSHLQLQDSLAGRAILKRRTMKTVDMTQAGDSARAEGLADEEFVTAHIVPLVAKGTVKGILEVFHCQPFDPDPEWRDFLETLAGQTAIAIDNTQLFESLQRSNVELALAYDTTLEGWARALELRDQETKGHSQRVTEMTLDVARALGVGEETLEHVRRGALLHDIGKMGIPDSILLKPGPLDDDEWDVMRQHPVYAYELLSPIPFLRPALDIPYCHHEKWDGTGYPRGLQGEQIPLPARVFAVVDVYDALTSDRPYRGPWPEEKALAYIREEAGSHFDPQVVEAFFEVVNEKGA